MKRNVFGILLLIFVNSCDFKKDVKQCFDFDRISKRFVLNDNYKLDSIYFNNKKISLKITIVEPALLEFQAEREHLFYALRDLSTCNVDVLDSITVFYFLNANKKTNFRFGSTDFFQIWHFGGLQSITMRQLIIY